MVYLSNKYEMVSCVRSTEKSRNIGRIHVDAFHKQVRPWKVNFGKLWSPIVQQASVLAFCDGGECMSL